MAIAHESCELVLDFLQLICDWWISPTSQKSFGSSSLQTFLFGREKRPPEIRLRSPAAEGTVGISLPGSWLNLFMVETTNVFG